MGRRISGTRGGAALGTILLIIAFPLLWWNEGRSLHRLQTLREGRGSVISVAADRILPTNNRKLIFVSGKATTEEVVGDDEFGVKENALALKREVEMYQWKEVYRSDPENRPKSSVPTYSTVWSDQAIDSSKFNIPVGHENPPMLYDGQSFLAHDARLGAFKLSTGFVSEITGYTFYPLTEQNASALGERLKSYFKLSDNEYFHGDPLSPKVGDIRIRYAVLRPTDVSVVGEQVDGWIQPHQTRTGDIQLLQNGIESADSMFGEAEETNTFETWFARVGGFLCMWLGLFMIGERIGQLSGILPFLGNIASAGSGLMAGFFAVVLSFATMAVAWVVYRPWIVGGLLVVAILIRWGAVGLGIRPRTKWTGSQN